MKANLDDFEDAIIRKEARLDGVAGEIYVNAYRIKNITWKMPHHVILRESNASEYDHEDLILGTTLDKPYVKLPPGVAVRVPENLQYEIHYINQEGRKINAEAEIILVPIEKPEQIVTAKDIKAPINLRPGESQTSGKIIFENDATITSLVPHMHDLGTRIVAEHNDKDLFNIQWENQFIEFIHLKEPINIAQGDSLRVTCYYNNTLNYTVIWPREMCVLLYTQIT
jgi:hypothetical protein